VDQQYFHYCDADPMFYDVVTEECDRELFTVSTREIPDRWTVTTRGIWTYLWPDGHEAPEQGWKIHVSACLDNADQILERVWDYCVAQGTGFKYLRDPHTQLLQNAKHAPRGSSGKLVTIYPTSENELRSILNDLDAELSGESGPYILSDLRWNAGPLHVRYGGFTPQTCVYPDGTVGPAIADPDGHLVPDRRTPTFTVPDWVTVPDFLRPQLDARAAATVADMPYSVERPLHFSNGGGIYAAHHKETGQKVLLREARPHAGLDGHRVDAVGRLDREHRMLTALAGLDVVPAVVDRFQCWEHQYLAVEFIEGMTLHKTQAQRHPLLQADPPREEVEAYTEWAVRVYANLRRAVAAIHERGIVFGDLHPFNVIIRPDERVTLVDFEAATHIEEGLRPSMGHPGFLAPPDRTGFEVDQYALGCMAISFFLPLTTLVRLDPTKAKHLAELAAERFPVPEGFFDQPLRDIAGSGPTSANYLTADHTLGLVRDVNPRTASWETLRSSIVGGILASATPDRDDRLYPGDIAQFSAGGGLNFAHGAAGVLYALAATGAERQDTHEQWLLDRLRASDGVGPGFYDGLSGIAYVLRNLGHHQMADNLVDRILDVPAGEQSLDLFGGLAGVGLTLLHWARADGRSSLRDTVLKLADEIDHRMGGVDHVGTISGRGGSRAGLMYGSSGLALFFIRLYQDTGDTAYLDCAATALRQDLKRCREDQFGRLVVDEGYRVVAYLAAGTAGIHDVIDEYLWCRHDDEFADAYSMIEPALRAGFCLQPGLLNGRSGFILSLANHAPRQGETRELHDQVRILALQSLPYDGKLAFPGEQLLRLSMDLASGSAGVLIALGAALSSQPVGLPFLDGNRTVNAGKLAA
jgi:hypothetical protein